MVSLPTLQTNWWEKKQTIHTPW